MKVLEFILNIFIRILNVPIIVLDVILIAFFSTIIHIIIIPLEFLIVAPIFYIITGEWYYDYCFGHPYYWWFPILGNVSTYLEFIWALRIPEINLNKKSPK